jgi:hypothetical protein
MHFTKNKPLFLFLLPVFFVLHGFIRNYTSVAAGDAILLTLYYIGASLLIAAPGYLFFRDITKACLFSFFLLSFNFCFGFVQDALKNLSSGSFLAQYRFLLPLSFLFFVVLIIWLKKRKKTFRLLAYYLNLLFLLFILIDSGILLIKISGNKKNKAFLYDPKTFVSCDTCKRPDIYLVLLDQYTGFTGLKEGFDFDNSAFEKRLKDSGFYVVPGSNSNYNLTPFSMASLLNMNYLSDEMGIKKHLNLSYSYNAVRKNLVLEFLDSSGYAFYNYSVFDFPGQPARKYKAFLPYGTELITYPTFIDRLYRDIKADILRGKIRFKTAQKKLAYEYLHFNDDIYNLTERIAAKKNTGPKFVYTHFIMPHWPYYFDSKGNPVPIEKLSKFRKTNTHDYIEYLQYCNGRILQLTDKILSTSSSPPIIILLGDHGFQHPGKEMNRKYDFINLNAVYLPEKNYSGFYYGMTNVNEFRVIFNTCFGQHLPMLKDSTIDLRE